MTRLASVSIRRFKRIETIDLPLGDVTLLIGANNSGKSSILQAIHFGVSLAQSARLIGEGLAWRNDTFELSFNPSQILYSPVGDVLSLATGGALQEPRERQIEIEFFADTGERCRVGLRRGRNRNIAVSIVGRTIGEQLMSLTNPFTVYAPGLAGIPKEERHLSPGVVRRIVARGDANLTLRNVLRMLRANDVSWNGFIGDMRSIFEGIDIEIVFDENTDENIEVYFRLPNGAYLPIDAAGTSVLQASQILAYIALFSPQVLILDEPDSHLHPDNQRLLCDLVFRLAAERSFQALISTHSRHVLNSVSARGSVIWMNKGRRVDTPDTKTTEVLLDLGALDSVDYFADGEIHCVVATEDSNQSAIRAVLSSNGFPPDVVEVASYAGCSKTDAALVLGSFLNEKAPSIHLVVHRDRDYLSAGAAAAFEERLSNADIHPFLTASNDIECHFINAAHLHQCNPAISLARVQELIDQATAETADKSIIALVNQRTAEAFRNRQAGGNVNHGEIAVTAAADYNADPAAHRRGKIVLGHLTSLLQQEMHANPWILIPTEHLRLPSLTAIAEEIWGAAV